MRRFLGFRFDLLFLCLVAASSVALAAPTPAALTAFDTYIAEVENRLLQQHRSAKDFLATKDAARLRRGEQIIEQVQPSSGPDLPGAMLHHWRGTAFASGATPADLERMMENFEAYPKDYAPQVVQARILTRRGDNFHVLMRTRQKHVITVVLDMNLDITFGRPDAQHGYSLSRSTQISEIESPDTPGERGLGPKENHGFLWRLNTYWSYEERDGGLYMQIETVSLSGAVPEGLGWAIKPFVESVPKESLEFTLRSTCDALRKEKAN